MIRVSEETADRLRAALSACLDGSKQVGAVRVVDPATGKHKYLGDLALELLKQIDTEAA